MFPQPSAINPTYRIQHIASQSANNSKLGKGQCRCRLRPGIGSMTPLGSAMAQLRLGRELHSQLLFILISDELKSACMP